MKELATALIKLQQISLWHTPYEDIEGAMFCAGCSWPWPCSTRRLIDKKED